MTVEVVLAVAVVVEPVETALDWPQSLVVVEASLLLLGGLLSSSWSVLEQFIENARKGLTASTILATCGEKRRRHTGNLYKVLTL